MLPGGKLWDAAGLPPPIGVQFPLKIHFWGLTNVSFTKGKRTSVANGRFWASIDWKRYKNGVVNSTAVFSFKMDNGGILTCLNSSFFSISRISSPHGRNLCCSSGTSGLAFSASRALLRKITCSICDFRVVSWFIDVILRIFHGWQVLHRCHFCARVITFLRNASFPIGKRMKTYVWHHNLIHFEALSEG